MGKTPWVLRMGLLLQLVASKGNPVVVTYFTVLSNFYSTR